MLGRRRKTQKRKTGVSHGNAFPKGQCDERSASGPVLQEGVVLEDRTSIGVKETFRFSLDDLKGCRWGHDEK